MMMRQSALREWRRFQRAPIKGRVIFGPITPSFEGRCMTIGMGGMYICSDRIFPPSVVLSLSFTLPSQTACIDIKGLVVYTLKKGEGAGKCQGPGMGVKFTEVSHQNEKLIHDYVVMRGRILRELKFLLAQEHPPMKRVNELLTASYLVDYTNLADLKAQVDREVKFLKLRKD